jgi:hypothetical protein
MGTFAQAPFQTAALLGQWQERQHFPHKISGDRDVQIDSDKTERGNGYDKNDQFDKQALDLLEPAGAAALSLQILGALDELLVLVFAVVAAEPPRGTRDDARAARGLPALLATRDGFHPRMIDAP